MHDDNKPGQKGEQVDPTSVGPNQNDKDDQGDEKKRRRRKRKRRNKDNGCGDDDDKTATTTTSALLKPAPTTIDEQRASECDRTVFVEGIPYDATEQDLRDFFVTHGNLLDIVECRLPVWQDSGRLRGYGHVVFGSLDSHQKAVQELSGKYLRNRFLSIQPARRPRDPTAEEDETGAAAGHGKQLLSEPSKTILLNNLSYEATEQDIQTVLEKFGTIVPGGVRVVRNSVNHKQSKGFAYVEFDDMVAATAVMQNRIVILNRPCRTDYDHGRVRGSFRTATGQLWQKEYGGTNKPTLHSEHQTGAKRQRQSRRQEQTQD
jgi:nucleolin